MREKFCFFIILFANISFGGSLSDIAEFTNDVCGKIELKESVTSWELKVAIEGKLKPKFLSKILGTVVSADGSYTVGGKGREGLPLGSLPAQITGERECKKTLATMLIKEREEIRKYNMERSEFEEEKTITDFKEKDLAPLVVFGGSVWNVTLRPPKSLRDDFSHIIYKVDGFEHTNNHLNFTIMELPSKDYNFIEIEVYNKDGESIGPYRYDYDFYESIQNFYNQVNEKNTTIEVKYHSNSSGFNVTRKSKFIPPWGTSFSYSFDGISWMNGPNIRNPGSSKKLYYKIFRYGTDIATRPLVYNIDFSALVRESYIVNFLHNSQQFKVKCRSRRGCGFDFSSYSMEHLSVVQTLNYGFEENNLSDKLPIVISDNHVSLEKFSYDEFRNIFLKLPCDKYGNSGHLYYNYTLFDGTSTKIRSTYFEKCTSDSMDEIQ